VTESHKTIGTFKSINRDENNHINNLMKKAKRLVNWLQTHNSTEDKQDWRTLPVIYHLSGIVWQQQTLQRRTKYNKKPQQLF
jgi:hypothetical protein